MQVLFGGLGLRFSGFSCDLVYPCTAQEPALDPQAAAEMREALVPPRASSISRRPVFVEGYVIMRSSFAVPIQVRRVSVVPVLLKLLPEHTLRCQLFLREKEARQGLTTLQMEE